MEQNENTLSVLKIAPGQHPQQVEIDNDLKPCSRLWAARLMLFTPLQTRWPSSAMTRASSWDCP